MKNKERLEQASIRREKVLALYELGLTANEIVAKTGEKYHNVSYILRMANASRQRIKDEAQKVKDITRYALKDISAYDIAKELELSAAQVIYLIKKHNIDYSYYRVKKKKNILNWLKAKFNDKKYTYIECELKDKWKTDKRTKVTEIKEKLFFYRIEDNIIKYGEYFV